MYLKSLEIVGFKSFADKTRLEFEPGMTCIVGPNGCGKSNIADAVRWVIGEQSAKALRGSTMQDVIFTGTDARKPMGMASVSITFAGCEGVLQTEYDEVTITRRVFRDGQGEYFLNKTPCRLKDIQRLFMDTGVGTTSYSLMEQGRIDRVLSARPEDRRAVFEEASGITKFKADKKEAIRKLESTEANLLRLADVIREVKRQIGSLQRQAGKARRYQELREELRQLDLFLTCERTRSADTALQALEREIAELGGQAEETHARIQALERQAGELREQITRNEHETTLVLESGVQARSSLQQRREKVETNRQRIAEYEAWRERDTREIDRNQQVVDEQQRAAEGTGRKLASVREQHEEARQKLDGASRTFADHQKAIDESRSRLQRLREKTLETESLISKVQNELIEIESRERSAVLQRERLASEKAQLTRSAELFTQRQEEMVKALGEMGAKASAGLNELRGMEESFAAKTDELRRVRQVHSEVHSQIAARKAQVDVLRESDGAPDRSAGGARLMLDKANPLGVDRAVILGVLADHVEVEEPFRIPLEAVLRDTLDALLMADRDSALGALRKLEEARKGACRLRVAGEAGGAAEGGPADGPGEPLLGHLTCTDAVRPLLTRLVGRVRVVEALAALPSPLPAGVTFATPRGAVLHADGLLEFSMPEPTAASPLGRKNLIKQAEKDLKTLTQQADGYRAAVATLSEDLQGLERSIRETRQHVDEKRRVLAQKEGESQVVSSEARQARERLDTVTFELESLAGQGRSHDERKQALASRVEKLREERDEQGRSVQEQNRDLAALETRHTGLQAELTEHRIRFAELTQEIRHIESQHAAALQRVQELQSAIQGRSAGIDSYRQGIERLSSEISAAEQDWPRLEQAVAEAEARAAALRRDRDELGGTLKQAEAALSGAREQNDAVRTRSSSLEVRRAEDRARRQNQIERVTSEYGVTVHDIIEAPEPQWPGEKPTADTIETSIAEIRTKIDAMGPVNLIAIEEYKELEERYSFLTAQEQDLVTSKDQLMEMIRKINRTTSEMFRSTFEQVNVNFEMMFQKLFNGGTAKLVLVNEEDVLECGIEIIARPPGKRLQNVSLLSGGERTMTAVALLFAIYMIRPSPFCLLDEMDAALDEANIGRFVAVLEGFLAQSQFVVITHNRRTIACASCVYGITMPEKGISKIVSMKFHDRPAETPEAADGAAEAAKVE